MTAQIGGGSVGWPAAKPVPIIPHFICSECDRRHSTRTEIGRDHVQFARPPKRGA